LAGQVALFQGNHKVLGILGVDLASYSTRVLN
jgi:hypothetical protein